MRGEPVRLVTIRDKCSQSSVDELRELLRMAESGEAVSVFGVIEFADGTYRNFGSSTMSRLQTAGALLEASIERLNRP